MTEDAIAKQLARLCDEVIGMRKDISGMRTDLAVEVRGSQEHERRIEKLEGEVRWAQRGVITGLIAWGGTVVMWLMTGGKP